MDLKDIKDLIKVLKSEEMAELKLKYGKVELTLVNSDIAVKETFHQNTTNNNNTLNNNLVMETNEPTTKEEIIKSLNVGIISFVNNIEKGMEVKKGMILAKVTTLNITNDIKATESGILKEILVTDNSLVDYGKSIFVLEV